MTNNSCYYVSWILWQSVFSVLIIIVFIVVSQVPLSNSREFTSHYLNDINHDDGFEDLTQPLRTNLGYYIRKTWPDGIVKYEISSEFNESQKKNITKAIKEISEKTCVKFHQRNFHNDEGTGKQHFLKIRMNQGDGCSTIVGLQKQVMSLDPTWCLEHGRILHELMHSIGFTHEHQRPDRDNFVVILWKNIKEDHRAQFIRKEYPSKYIANFPYDYTSIMHYANWSAHAAIDTSKPIIFPKIFQPRMGQRVALDELDVYKVNLLYNCDKKDKKQ